MSCTDWIAYGLAEEHDDGSLSMGSARDALLSNKHNPRRTLVSPVVLCSDNARCREFVTPNGWCSSPMASPLSTPTASPSPANTCTDFVLEAMPTPDLDGSFPRRAMCNSLSGEPGPRATRVTVTSHNEASSTGSHFTLANGLCSAPLTNADIVWMEKTSGVPPGTLFKFKALAENTTVAPEAVSACEEPWAPMARYHALARTLKPQRGAKSFEHLKNLRKSDPLINLSAWHDWQQLAARVKRSKAARVHQQALIDRAFRAHAQQTVSQTASHLMAALEREKNKETTTRFLADRVERTSADSVISLLVDPAIATADYSDSSEPGSPQASPHSILDMDGLGAPHKLPPPQYAPHGKPHGALHATHRKGMPHPPFKAKQRLFPAPAAALVRE